MTRRFVTRRRVAGILLVLYLVGLALIATWPTPVDRPVDGLLFRVIGRLQDAGFGWISYDLVESSANVALFVPFGLLLAALFGRGWTLLALACCVAATFTIEFVQLEFLAARHASLGDIAANSLGAIIGVGLVVVGRAIGGRRRRARSLAA